MADKRITNGLQGEKKGNVRPNTLGNASHTNVRRQQPAVRSRGTAEKGNVGVKMNINEQTPSRRRSAKEAKRIDPELPEIKRSAKRTQGYKIKKKKKPISREAVAYGIIFLTVFILISTVCAIVFYANLVKTESNELDSVKLKIGLSHMSDELQSSKVDPELYMRDGIMYVDLSLIAERFGFVTTGDHKELRYITDVKLGESICVWLNTPFVEINGTMVRLNGDITKDEESVFIPAEFFSEYASGIKIEFDEEESVISVLRETGINENGKLVEKDITFKLKKASPSQSLPEGELTAEEELKTYFDPNEILPAETLG